MTLNVYSGAGKLVATAEFTLEDEYFVSSNITEFLVEPLNTGVGQFPVVYKFTVTPAGDVEEDSYFVLQLPEEVGVYDELELERECGGELEGFTYVNIHCKLNTDRILIQNGFKLEGTTNMTDDDGSDLPPTFVFYLPEFRNPRQTEETSNFNITIYNVQDDLLY